METAFEFSPKKDQIVNIDFCDGWYLYRKNREIVKATYCTISVLEPNGEIKNYHDGCVCNPDDTYDTLTGIFLSFKKCLRHRWNDKHSEHSEHLWTLYHKKWAHLLSAMIDGKVTDDENLF